MRKVYCSPVADVVELVVSAVIAASGAQGGTGVGIGPGTVSPDEAWADESRNAWSDIWDSM
ncbi:MAG: hypothetical protein IKW46_04090 [Bacteroidaceae bacterium]|nr:hypothetical protein [Bacteroidaceae bacterium]